MDIKDIYLPISDDFPYGEDIRVHFEAKSLYLQLKELRNLARNYERQGENIFSQNVALYWNDVNRISLQVLSEYSKDIEVLCWLAEAQLRIHGYRGLNDTVRLMTVLLESYGKDLHSLPDETGEERLSPFAGLNGVGSEGVLIQALRLAPLIPGMSFGKNCLWDYQRAQRQDERALHDEIYQSAVDAGYAIMSAHSDIIMSCFNHFQTLSMMLGEVFEVDAPSVSNICNTLQEAAFAIRDMIGAEELPTTSPALQAENALQAEQAANLCEEQMAGDIILLQQLGSREDAFKVLFVVARYFRRTEPHSPMAPALETLIQRGGMDFQQLLSELLPDQAMRASILTAAGIHVPMEG